MENNVRKGEIACNKQFLLFSLCLPPYTTLIFSSPEHRVLSPEHRVLSELLWSLTVRQCPSVHNLLVNTLASTNINQSSPNLVKMYMTTRSLMSFIMEPIGTELSELSALELENLPYLTMFTL